MAVLFHRICRMEGLFILTCLCLVNGLSLDEIHANRSPLKKWNNHGLRSNMPEARELNLRTIPYPFNKVHKLVSGTDTSQRQSVFRNLKKDQFFVPSEVLTSSDGLSAAGVSNKLLHTLKEIDRQVAPKEVAVQDQKESTNLYSQLRKRQYYNDEGKEATSLLSGDDYDINIGSTHAPYTPRILSLAIKPSFWEKQVYSPLPSFTDTYNKWRDVSDSNPQLPKKPVWNKYSEDDLFSNEEPEFDYFFPFSTSNKAQQLIKENTQFPSLKKKLRMQMSMLEPRNMYNNFQEATKGSSLLIPIRGDKLLIGNNRKANEDIFNRLSSEIEPRNNEKDSLKYLLGDSDDGNEDDESGVITFGTDNSSPFFTKTKRLVLKKRDYKFNDDRKSATKKELKEIFKDESAAQNIKKRRAKSSQDELFQSRNEKNETDYSKATNKNEFKKYSDEITTEISTREPRNSNEYFEKWLRKEYIKNMAKVLNTLRKKRSNDDWNLMISKDIEDLQQENGQTSKNVNRIENVEHSKKTTKEDKFVSNGVEKTKSFAFQEEQFQQVKNMLKKIENNMLTDAVEMIKEGTTKSDLLDPEKISHKLEVAMELDNLRKALAHLHTTFDNIQHDNQEGENTSLGMFHFLEKKPNGEEEDHKEIFEKIQAQPARGSKSSMAASSNHYYNGKPNQRNEDSCPPLQLLTNNCSSLGEYLPQDSLRQMLRHACNWYDVCYACGKTFGLTLDECDEGFLEESSALCRDDQPCKTITRFFLQPLRNTKVLFKRSVAQLCYTDRCVEEFLKWHYINNPIN